MIERLLERFLFASRWLLAPFFVLLVGGLAALLIKAIQHTGDFLGNLLAGNETQVIVDILSYVDLTLTAFLVVIVIFSGYENFVSTLSSRGDERWPKWLTKIDFSGLKLKLLSSIVAISAIELLRLFMDVSATSNRDLAWSVGIHLTFVLSGLILAITDRVSGHEADANAHRAAPDHTPQP